ncbi:putative proliferating cell nuclear antigen, PCNA [Helianthus annuus]|nr:putative proliferating cell nuclear antigen, PCNA [Helianthus annuus]
MLEVKSVQQCTMLKKVIESITDLVYNVDANFECSSTGISLQAIDPIHEAMVSLLLRSDGFQHYCCDPNMSLGINLGSLADMLMCAGDDDIVTVKAHDGQNCLSFMFENLDQDKITNFEMKLMDVDYEPLEIKECKYDAVVRMPSSEFARICKDLNTMGDIVAISVTEDGLQFLTKGDTGTANIVCRQNPFADKREEATIIEMVKPVSEKYTLRFLKSFTKAAPLASQVTLSLASDWPMMVEYKIAEMGHLRFYLAPKMNKGNGQNVDLVELKSVQGSMLRKAIKTIANLVNDVDAKFECSSTGVSLQAMDPMHQAIVSLLLRSDGFEHYRCDRNMSLGINLGVMAKMLKCAGDNDIVTIKAADGDDCVNIMFENFDQKKITNFEMKLTDVDYKPLQIPEFSYDATVRMPSSEFARICNDFSTVGDTVVISFTKEGLEFSTKGDTGTANIVCTQNTFGNKPEEATIIETWKPVSAKFELSYLNSFTEATPLASQVTLSLCSTGLLKVEYKIVEMGYLKFGLAAKGEEVKKMNGEPVKTKSNGKTKREVNKEDMKAKKRHRAKVEKIKEEKLRLKKEEQEYKIILLKEEVRMMQQKQMDKDMKFFSMPHDNLAGAALDAVLARKCEIAQRWGWE